MGSNKILILVYGLCFVWVDGFDRKCERVFAPRLLFDNVANRLGYYEFAQRLTMEIIPSICKMKNRNVCVILALLVWLQFGFGGNNG